MNRKWGECALCGKECELTYEHIPPRNAFNNLRTKVVDGTTYFENLSLGEDAKNFDELKYENAQQGKGKYSLCKACNNNTGTWYGPAYVNFAHSMAYSLNRVNVKRGEYLNVTGIMIKPLNIIKQVMSMFCSINNICRTDYLNPLQKFVLDRNSHDLGQFRLGIFVFLRGCERLTPFTISGFLPEPTSLFSEMISFPFGFILIDKEKSYDFPFEVTDISSFADYDYNQEIEADFPRLPVYETADMTPGIVLR